MEVINDSPSLASVAANVKIIITRNGEMEEFGILVTAIYKITRRVIVSNVRRIIRRCFRCKLISVSIVNTQNINAFWLIRVI